MPIYMEISRLHRTVTIVARGTIDPEEIRGMAMRLVEAKVRPFAKILEIGAARTEFTPEQIQRLSLLLRGNSSEPRGPIAFVVDADRGEFARAFAEETGGEGPVRLFTSLREARRWTEQELDATARGQASMPAGENAATDPTRQGVLMVGNRQREVTIRQLETA